MNTNGQPPGSRVISIYDYPEHLNPFYEDDNHNKIRFWTIGRKKTRSNSFSLSGIRNAIKLRSFRGKMKTPLEMQNQSDEVTLRSRTDNLSRSVESVPCTTMGRNGPHRVFGGGFVTPTPLPRFQHQNMEEPLEQNENRNSNMSLNSACKPVKPYRKKRPAPPPPINISTEKVLNVNLEDECFNTELKIVEDSANEKPVENLSQEQDIKSDNDVKVELKVLEENHSTQDNSTNNVTPIISDEKISPDKDSALPAETGETNENSISVQNLEISETINNDILEEKQILGTESSEQTQKSEPIDNITELNNSKTEDIDEKCENLVSSEVSIPIPKVRTVITVTLSEKENETKLNQHCNDESNSLNNCETIEKIDMDKTASKAKAIEELDKCAKDIDKLLKELDITSTENLGDNSDDTNNNVKTYPDISNDLNSKTVQLNSSSEYSITDTTNVTMSS